MSAEEIKTGAADGQSELKRLVSWEPNNKTQYSQGEIGKVGKYACFGIHWDASRSKGSDTPPHKLTCKLPGIKSDLGNFRTESEAMDRAEQVLWLWMNGAGLYASQ